MGLLYRQDHQCVYSYDTSKDVSLRLLLKVRHQSYDQKNYGDIPTVVDFVEVD